MMLRYSLDLDQEADAVEQAVQKVLSQGYRMANICHTYENTNELKNKIKQLLTSNEKYDKEYDEFIREHSDEFILQQMKTTFI